MGADGCGECMNKNGCFVKTTLEQGLVTSVYKSDEHGRALAEAMLARLLKFQLLEPLWGSLLHS